MSIITEALKKAQEKRSKKEDPSEILLKYPIPTSMPGSSQIPGTKPKRSKSPVGGINKPIGALILILLVILLGSLTGILLHRIGPSPTPDTENIQKQNTAQPFFYQNAKSPSSASSESENFELISVRGRTLPVLSGVMYSPVNPQAIINGTLVSEGDKIGEFKLIKIYPASVKISSGEEDFELKLR